MRPDIYFIRRVVQIPEALPSALIPSGTTRTREARTCESCIFDSYAGPYDFLVQGFDDFDQLDTSVSAFLPEGPPLIAPRSHCVDLASILSGVTAVRVGYNYWEQRPVAPGKWFELEPLLGALFVTAVAPRMRDEHGEPLSRCARCGRQIVSLSRFTERAAEYSLDYETWPRTDLFLVEGLMQSSGICLTSTGLEKLRRLGFANFDLVPLVWSEL